MNNKYEYAKGSLRAHFFENTGRIMSSAELREVLGYPDLEGCIRELREEEGYQILTQSDCGNLKPGEYLLETDKPLPAFAPELSEVARSVALANDNFCCYRCGAVAGEPHPYDPSKKTRLHIGHIIDKSMGVTDDPANLRAICSVCNEGASNITLTRPDLQKLLGSCLADSWVF